MSDSPLHWIEISRSALANNVKTIKKQLSSKTLLMAMVKANAYGHGLSLIAPVISPQVDWFGVNTIDEALIIRKLDLKNPILITAPIADFSTALKNNISICAHSLRYLKSLSSLPLSIHLKINTGMNRLGIQPSEIDTALKLIKKSSLKLEGIYTHFHSADTSKKSVQNQLQIFLPLVKQAKSLFPQVLTHCANSSAIFNYPDTHLDLVRPGIRLYNNVLTWKARVVQSRLLNLGQIIGYSATFRVKKPLYETVIPVGYSDGLDRRFSNQLSFIGRISMNFATIKTPQLLPENSIYEIIGPSQTVDLLAQKINTINYEILSRLNPLIPRVIIDQC